MPNTGGYFDTNTGTLKAKSVETWDDFDASSAGNDWDSLTSWNGTPQTLVYTTKIYDTGVSKFQYYFITVDANMPVSITVYYGDSIDSAGGAIDSATTLATVPGQVGLTPKKARYWQFEITAQADSANDISPEIDGALVQLQSDQIQEIVTDVNTANLSGSTGVRQLDSIGRIKTVTGIVTQAHTPTASPYVASGYVADTYVETATTTDTPMVYVDKTTEPPTLNIFDIDAFGKRKYMDCTIDAIVTGLGNMETDDAGSIVASVVDIGTL